jgi:hypothetical protein
MNAQDRDQRIREKAHQMWLEKVSPREELMPIGIWPRSWSPSSSH